MINSFMEEQMDDELRKLRAAMLADQLPGHTGSLQYWKNPFHPFRYTDGVKFLAEMAECYWLLDAIASWQISPKVRGDKMLGEIQFWTLEVKENHSAKLMCERDKNDVAVTQKIGYTDFPLPKIKLYLQAMSFYKPGVGGVLMLPSEY